LNRSRVRANITIAMDVRGLPGLVSRYLDRALPVRPSPATIVRVVQTGEMVLRPGRRPLRFDAVEEFSTDQVAFAWRARFPIIGSLALRVTDSYQPPDGSLEVRLLGIPVQRRSGAELARGEAFRYLAEIPWVPHAILVNGQLQWQDVDERTVEVSTDVAGERVAVRLIFEGDDIVQTVADRPRLEAGGALTRWIGEYRHYASFDDVRVPSRGEVRWELPQGPFTYWRGTITSLEAYG
jgi:hypothetical protein